MELAFTANGPGELAGWVRPLLHRLVTRLPDARLHIFLVPDDYATGAEARVARDLFPRARVYEPREYVRVALGGSAQGLPKAFDLVQYLGGDLMHAARLHRRFGGKAATYKFSRKRYRKMFESAFAVDAKNADELVAWGMPRERVHIVGNLAIDGAFDEAGEADGVLPKRDGLVILPGSRGYEIEHLVPFFFSVAMRLRREQPGLAISFAISPFTSREQLRAAIERGGDRRLFAQRGRFEESAGQTYFTSIDGQERFPVVERASLAARCAALALTIPGTKSIELAALGVPMVAVTPLNAPELITINGPLTYLDRLPFVGAPLKRAVVISVAKRFTYHTQPNIDASAPLVRELHGTLTPGRVARVVADALADASWREDAGMRLKELYREHRGASTRMADLLVEGLP